MSENNINSFVRLREIINKVARLPIRDESNQNRKISNRETWCNLFNIKNPHSESALLEVIERVLELRRLFSEVISSLNNIEGIEDSLFIEPITEMSSIASSVNNLERPWEELRKPLTSANLTSLKYIEKLFAEQVGFKEQIISSDELLNILNELDSIYEQILNSDLPDELKADLLDLLQELRKGIHGYRARGAKSLKEALGKSAGILFANKEEIEKYKDNDELESLSKMLIRIDKVYSFAVKMKPLLETVSKMLPLLLPPVSGK